MHTYDAPTSLLPLPPQERLRYEVDSLREMHRHSPAHVPEVYLHDAAMSLVAMQYLAPPHVIMRHGILAGHVYPNAAAQLSDLLACTLFRTSLIALSEDEFRRKADTYGNSEMCSLTEQVCSP